MEQAFKPLGAYSISGSRAYRPDEGEIPVKLVNDTQETATGRLFLPGTRAWRSLGQTETQFTSHLSDGRPRAGTGRTSDAGRVQAGGQGLLGRQAVVTDDFPAQCADRGRNAGP